MLYRLFELLRPLLGVALIAAFLTTPLIGFFARFGDGPLGPFPGGPLQGPIEEPPDSWGFAARTDTLEIQIDADPPRSVRTGVVLHQGTPYVPVLLEPLARWDDAVHSAPSVIVRIEGRLYELRARPVYDPDWLDTLHERAQEKYGRLLFGDWAAEWTGFFRLDRP